MSRKPKPVSETEKEKNQLLDIYTDFVQENGRCPKRADLLQLNVKYSKVTFYFGCVKGMKQFAKKRNPEAFKHIIDEDFFSDERMAKSMAEIAKHRTFLITTAVTGAMVHDGFLASAKQFCKENDALLLIMLATDPASSGDHSIIDPQLADEHVIFQEIHLNDNLFISDIKISAKQINPLTGLRRAAQSRGSFIFAAPKQFMSVAPTSNVKLPHQTMTTGACTLPNYAPDPSRPHSYMSERTAYLADLDHGLGAIVVEIQDDQVFHTRQVQGDSMGSFIDLGRKYTGTGEVESVRAAALVLGDWHSGETDPYAAYAFLSGKNSVASVVNPRALVVHDGFNGMSISHHEIKDAVLRAQRAQANKLSLQQELIEYARDLDRMAELADEIVVVASNHDDFLARYLSDGRFVEEPQNAQFASRLFDHMCAGENPLRYAVESLIGLKHPKKITWLSVDEDRFIGGVQVGAHGHKGPNGSRGNLAGMESAYTKSVTGHSHTPGILRGAWAVGTCSLLKLNYNKGPSSWMHTSCIVYDNGDRQLINVINGQWRPGMPTMPKQAKRKAA